MSSILGSIISALGSLFEKLLPSWRNLMPPELPKPFEPPVSEEESEEKEEGKSEYETTDERDIISESESDNKSKPEEEKIIF